MKCFYRKNSTYISNKLGLYNNYNYNTIQVSNRYKLTQASIIEKLDMISLTVV